MGYFATGKQTQLLNIYENKPKEESISFPTIILFTHVHGIDDPMKKVVDDLASAGYYGIAVDPYLNGSYNPHIKRRSDKGIFDRRQGSLWSTRKIFWSGHWN